jgi:hypothetical protein
MLVNAPQVVAIITTIAGIAVGWLLSQLGFRWQLAREDRRRIFRVVTELLRAQGLALRVARMYIQWPLLDHHSESSLTIKKWRQILIEGEALDLLGVANMLAEIDPVAAYDLHRRREVLARADHLDEKVAAEMGQAAYYELLRIAGAMYRALGVDLSRMAVSLARRVDRSVSQDIGKLLDLTAADPELENIQELIAGIKDSSSASATVDAKLSEWLGSSRFTDTDRADLLSWIRRYRRIDPASIARPTTDL